MLDFQQVFDQTPIPQCLLKANAEILSINQYLKDLLGLNTLQNLRDILSEEIKEIPIQLNIPWQVHIHTPKYKGEAEFVFYKINPKHFLAQVKLKPNETVNTDLLIARLSVLVKEIAMYLPNPFKIFDLKEQRNVYSNHRLREVLNYNQVEYSSLGEDTLGLLVHPEDQILLENLKKDFTQATSRLNQSIKLRLTHKGGYYQWFQLYVTNIGTIQGVFNRYLLITAHDIDEEKNLQAQLNYKNEKLNQRQERNAKVMKRLVENSHLLKGIADTMPAALSAYDFAQQKYIFNNYQLAPLLGYSIREYKSWKDPIRHLVHPEELDAVLSTREKLTTSIELEIQECRLRHEQGHYLHFVTSMRRIPNSNIAVTIFQEVEKIKENEKRILEYQQFIDELINSSPAIVHIFNETNNQLIYYNEQMEVILGYDSEKTAKIAKNLIAYIHPDDHAYIISNKAKMYKNKNKDKIYRFQYRVKDVEGKWVWLATQEKIFKFNNAGEVIQSIGSTVSVNQLKIHQERLTKLNQQLIHRNQTLTAQEEELRTNQEELENILEELSQRNFELDQLVYKISHDLRSPLSTILGLVSIMKDNPSPEEQRRYVEYIESRVLKLDGFIRDMISYAKSARKSIKPELLDLEFMIQDCLKDLEHLPSYGNIDISLEVFHEGQSFYSDSLRIQAILGNIISNAIKYYNPHRSDSFLKIKVVIDNKQAQFSFKDNGIGIKDEMLDRIFDMFFRATNSVEGSGLGMYIVKQNVDKLNGSISVKSNLGEGTSFELILPNNHKSEGV